MYYKKGYYRSDIVLTKDMKVELNGNDKFNLVTPKKTMYFRVYHNDSAKDWVTAIHKAIKKLH